MAKAGGLRRDWGTLFFDESSSRVRLWYCRGQVHTTSELAEANIHPLRAWYLGEFGPRDYDAEKVAKSVAALMADERKRGADVVEAARVAENVSWIRSTQNTSRFKLAPAQRAALLAGRTIEFGDLFGTMKAGERKP